MCQLSTQKGDGLLQLHLEGSDSNAYPSQTRCDGTQPGCKTCEVYQDECRYEKPPPMSQIIAMAKRLQDAEQTIAELTNMKIMGINASPNTQPPEPSENVAHQDPYYIVRSPSEEPSPEALSSDLSLDENGKVSPPSLMITARFTL